MFSFTWLWILFCSSSTSSCVASRAAIARRRRSTSSSSSIRCFSGASACRLAARKSARADGAVMLASTWAASSGVFGDSSITRLACWRTLAISASSPGPASSRSSSTSTSPMANGSVPVRWFSRNRVSPWTMIDWLPSGSLNNLRIMHATPTGCRSSVSGSSVSAFRWATTPITFSPGMTSSSRALDLGRPTLSGMTVPGKTTMLRIGRIGSCLGMVSGWPLPPVRMTVPVAVRSMIWESDMVQVGELRVGSGELRQASRAGPESARCQLPTPNSQLPTHLLGSSIHSIPLR